MTHVSVIVFLSLPSITDCGGTFVKPHMLNIKYLASCILTMQDMFGEGFAVFAEVGTDIKHCSCSHSLPRDKHYVRAAAHPFLEILIRM